MIELLLGLGLALGMPTEQAAAPASATAQRPADPARAEQAKRLAALLNSEAIIIGDAADDARAVALMGELVEGNREIAALEKERPGVIREMAVAIMPIINGSMKQRLPVLWSRQAALYAEQFDAAELATLVGFYCSPTGAKLIAGMKREIRPTTMMAEAKRSPDFSFSADSALKDVKASVPRIMADMDAGDQVALLKLAATGLLPRMQKLGPATQKIALGWWAESAPGEDAEIGKAIKRVVERRGR